MILRLSSLPAVVCASALLAAPSLTAQSGFDAQPAAERSDWLVDRSAFPANFRVDSASHGPVLILENGLVRRTWKVGPNLACIGYDNLMTAQTMIRAVRPEARLVVGGQEIDVGGLQGQPNQAFLTDAWLSEMTADPQAMRFVGYEVVPIEERLAWKRIRHHAPDAQWPPKGIAVRFDFEPGATPARRLLLHTDYARGLLDSDAFQALDEAWTVQSTRGDDSTVQNEGKVGEIQIPANHTAFLEKAVPAGVGMIQAEIHPGTDVSASWGPGIAAVFQDRVVKFNLRPGKEGIGVWDGQTEHVQDGGFPMDRPYRLRIYFEQDRTVCAVQPFGAGDAGALWKDLFELPAVQDSPTHVRIGKMDKAGGAQAHADPGPVGRCKLEGYSAHTPLDEAALRLVQENDVRMGVRVSIRYELYDGIPLIGKRVTVRNAGQEAFELDHLTTEILAVVETTNWVERRDDAIIPTPDHFHVETDYAFGGFVHENAQTQIVHWRPDPEFHTQVNYLKQTPCLLEVEPLRGPDVLIPPSQELQSWWTFELAYDSTDRERRGLAERKMYRVLAPWVTENPLILHVVSTDEAVVKRAIDQAAECGFEMVSLSFGSGLNMEDDSAANHAKFRRLVDYAMERGIHLGGYSLLASRRIQPDSDNAINVESGEAGGGRFGYAPALASQWGQDYFRKLYAFFEKTGFLQFTHDGSYPGDWDAAPRPPLQRGYEDSQWVQWNIITAYYRWLRARGAYVRVPDFYYLQGSNECGMGYREVNWSLPRAQQVIHTRQNIFDGTWTKTPSMGWMFVPLTQYHGGGAAATIEPLDEHLDHYERMLASNLGLGVQAVYRGHRLYDTPRVRDAVKRWVDWYKHYRDILEADLIHGRRADGRAPDWMLHARPGAELAGMLVVYNPHMEATEIELEVPLELTGLRDEIEVAYGWQNEIDARATSTMSLSADKMARLSLPLPPHGMAWVRFSQR